MRGDGKLFVSELHVIESSDVLNADITTLALTTGGITIDSGGLVVRACSCWLGCVSLILKGHGHAHAQITSGGETIRGGGLTAYDRVYLESEQRNILALYIDATGGFTNSAMSITGAEVREAGSCLIVQSCTKELCPARVCCSVCCSVCCPCVGRHRPATSI